MFCFVIAIEFQEPPTQGVGYIVVREEAADLRQWLFNDECKQLAIPLENYRWELGKLC